MFNLFLKIIFFLQQLLYPAFFLHFNEPFLFHLKVFNLHFDFFDLLILVLFSTLKDILEFSIKDFELSGYNAKLELLCFVVHHQF